MQSKAATVQQYLASLPDCREAIGKVREVVLRHLDREFEEGMHWGGICYYVPHRVFPKGYRCDPQKPLPFGGLASQKNYMSLYLMCLYGDVESERRFRTEWAKTGKKLDMGKCCIRFKRVEDLALDVLGKTIARIKAREYVAKYQAALAAPRARPAGKPKSAARAVTKPRRTTTAARGARAAAGRVAGARKR